MTKHFLITAVYALLAVAVALVGPRLIPGAGPFQAWLLGAVVFVAAALVHEIFTRQQRLASLEGRVEALSLELGCIGERANGAADEIRRVEQSIETLAEGGESRAREDLDRVVSEVRVLQSLIERLSETPAAAHDAAHDKPRPQKDAGRESPHATPASLDDAEVIDIVREGLRRDRVDLYLQPVVSLPQRKTRFYECFSRIRDERGNVVLPDQYMEVAKREGQIAAIDNLLLFRCVQLVRRAQSRNHNIGFFCNISANTLQDRDFFSEFVTFMGENQELARNLIFEFRQSDLETHMREVDDYISRLGRFGFYFSLDHVEDLAKLDIEALARRRFRFIKISARTLLEGRDETAADAAAGDDGTVSGPNVAAERVIGVNVSLLKRAMDRYDIDLIVEKIEREQDLLELLDDRIDYGQGYLFGEPRLSRDG